MISFEHRVVSEYKIKISKAKGASEFLDALVNEIDGFYKEHSEILSKNGKRPHARSRLPETKQWVDNIERFYELNPRRRPRK